MTDECRARLAARQAELIRALYGGPPVHGLDARMVAITSGALADKRARAVARASPALARGLDTDFADRFAAYARATPPPHGGGLADGLAFSGILAREKRLPDDARIERLVATTRVKLRHNRLAARRMPRLAVTPISQRGRLVVIVSLPPIGARLFALGPLPRGFSQHPSRPS
jgi:hypothetical protein